jgi:hypothetical protein
MISGGVKMADKIKSARELAMEKYGITSDMDRTLSDDQKNRISEIRNFYKSKKAELEILHQQNLKKMVPPQGDPREFQEYKTKLEDEYLRDRSRLEGEEERKIAEIRKK